MTCINSFNSTLLSVVSVEATKITCMRRFFHVLSVLNRSIHISYFTIGYSLVIFKKGLEIKMGSFLSRILLMAFGYAYPAYRCFKTVENKKSEIQQLRFWCQYWILVAILTVCERIADAFVSWLPLYNEVKLAFVVYLWYPKWKGTTYVYDSFLRPYLVKHETEIDRNLFELKLKAEEVGFLYWHRAVSYGQTRFLEILQYFSSQEASEPCLDYQQQQNIRKAESPASSQKSPAKPEQLNLKQSLPCSFSLSEQQFDTTNEPGFHHESQGNKRMISEQSCVKTTGQLSVNQSDTVANQPTLTSSLGNEDSKSSQEQTSYKEAGTKRSGIWRIFKSTATH